MDDNHSSVSLCIFCRSSGRGNVAVKGREDRESGKGRNVKRGGEAEKNEAGEVAEQGFVVLLPNWKMGR